MKRNPKRNNLQCENNHGELIERAHQAAGNWRQFESFGWARAAELDKPGDWTIVYTQHRDSRLLDQSNAAVIQHALQPYLDEDDPDVIEEHHGHWAVGWIDGFAIRVFCNGKVTRCFARTWKLPSNWMSIRSWTRRTIAGGSMRRRWRISNRPRRGCDIHTNCRRDGRRRCSVGSGNMTSRRWRTAMIVVDTRVKSSWNRPSRRWPIGGLMIRPRCCPRCCKDQKGTVPISRSEKTGTAPWRVEAERNGPRVDAAGGSRPNSPRIAPVSFDDRKPPPLPRARCRSPSLRLRTAAACGFPPRPAKAVPGRACHLGLADSSPPKPSAQLGWFCFPLGGP